MCNHDCAPNAVLSFTPSSRGGACRHARLVATRAVRAGERVTISYGPLASSEGRPRRRRFLRDRYYFSCSCAACAREAAGTEGAVASPAAANAHTPSRPVKPSHPPPRETEIRCAIAACGGTLCAAGAAFRCAVCGREETAQTALTRARAALARLSRAPASVAAARTVLATFSEQSAKAGAAWDALARVHATQSEWPDAAEALERAAGAYGAAMGPACSERAHALAKQAQALWMAARGRRASPARVAARRRALEALAACGERGTDLYAAVAQLPSE